MKNYKRFANDWSCYTPLLVVPLFFLLTAGVNAAKGGKPAPPPEPACDYYVNDLTGSDSNPGTSESDAWKSLRKAASSSAGFVAGDVICFRRGQRFYNVVNGNLTSSGTAANPITYTAYGPETEAKPRLSNAELISSRSEWIDLLDGRFIYTGYTGSVTNNLWEDGVPRASASSAALTDGYWYYEPGTGLYYRPGNGSYRDHEVHFAANGVVFAISGLSGLAFRDLVFEYTGSGLYGTSKTAAISHLTVENCEFRSIGSGIGLWSFTVDGVANENHHIDIRNNVFDTIRFAVRLNGSDLTNGVTKAHTATSTRNVDIVGNTVRNISLNGAYALKDTTPDVEVFSSQNLKDALISGNDVQDGVKRSHGFTTIDGDPLDSVGFVAWVHPDTTIDNVRIEKNHFSNLGAGVVLGASPFYRLNSNIIANNIITHSEIGLRLNSGDQNGSSGVYHNTLIGNDVNIYANSGAWGYQIYNNLSVDPLLYHVQITESVGLNSSYGSNMYVPDGQLFHVKFNAGVHELAGWIAATGQDVDSFAAQDAEFASAAGNEPADFMLQATSPAKDAGVDIAVVNDDFGSGARPKGKAPDLGAWER